DPVKARCLAAEDDVGVQGIRGDIAILFNANGSEAAEVDCTMVASTRHGRRATLLLPAVYPVWKPVIGNDMVELRRWLVIPGTPSFAAIHRDGCTLVDP